MYFTFAITKIIKNKRKRFKYKKQDQNIFKIFKK